MTTRNAVNSVPYIDEVKTTVYTSNATHNMDSKMIFATVQAVAGGGAGGGTGDTTVELAQAGVGGQGGSYAEFTDVAPGWDVPLSITVGAGGAGVADGDGNAGGNTIIGATPLFEVFGGAGGQRTSATANYAGQSTAAVVVPSSGTVDWDTIGEAGEGAFVKGGPATDRFAWGGAGGVTQLSTGNGGNRLSTGGVIDGLDAQNAGAGGGGACSLATTTPGTGGNGADGMVIITEYLAF